MARSVSFYGPQARDPLGAARAQPRNALLQAMLADVGDMSPARGGWGEGIARALKGGLAGLAERRVREQEEERESAAKQAIMKALTGEQIEAAQGPPAQMGGGVTSQPISRQPNDRSAMIAALAGNPDTAGMAMNLKLQEMQRAQELADEQRRSTAQDQTWQQRFQAQQSARQAEAERQRAHDLRLRQTPAARAPVPGVDVPFSDEVYQQRVNTELAKVQAKAAAKGPTLTPGQRKIDETIGKDLATFVASGGSADVEKNVAQLGRAVAELEKGGVTGTTVGWLPDEVLGIFNQRAVDTQEAVSEVTQRNLRLILGAQFTAKEGQQLIRRAFNPYLDEKINVRRVKALQDAIVSAAQAKQEAWDYMQKHGTMQGFKGKLWTKGDIEAAIDAADGGDVSRETIPKGGGSKRKRYNPATGQLEDVE